MLTVFVDSEYCSAATCPDILFKTGKPAKPVLVERQSFITGTSLSGAVSSSMKTDDGEYTVRFYPIREPSGNGSLAFEFEVPRIGKSYFVLPRTQLDMPRLHQKYRTEFFKGQDWKATSGAGDKVGNLIVDFVIQDFSDATSPKLHYYKLKFIGLNKTSGEPPHSVEILFDQVKSK